ncbi:hypothetical protein NVR52_10105 [Enterobacter roggenkampii]|uniref:hypothetical protein n=1 Tax=Enterobacter roggenkampii TaxID=1812935 RepID=UPI00254BBA81|nr:hypothetical protein [Enterobacter roggenkampii]MDK9941489.1 hypothetical protein [Enterobacter roggenkampii]MDK9946374.1 hypothetical protein [Enterobacter roggenkampii]
MTANKPMTGEQLDELMTVAVNMQRDAETDCNRPSAMFAYAVQVAILELRKVRNDAAALAAENALLKKSEPAPFSKLMMEALDVYQAGRGSIKTRGGRCRDNCNLCDYRYHQPWL